ncbi:MAG TPA: cytochrome c [Candidatus Binatia bacterium]|nr:cytochrome c [Candidatus Binatia bacterium]
MRKLVTRVGRSVVLLSAGCLIGSMVISSAWADDAQQVFAKNCVSCHGATGKGDGPASKMLKPPPEDFAKALTGMSDADIAKIIKEGGKAVGKAPSMPGYGSKLNDEQINGLVTFIKGLK